MSAIVLYAIRRSTPSAAKKDLRKSVAQKIQHHKKVIQIKATEPVYAEAACNSCKAIKKVDDRKIAFSYRGYRIGFFLSKA